MRIFSGIQPTGRKHLGNYIGAIASTSRARTAAIRRSTTSSTCTRRACAYDPGALPGYVLDTAAMLIAAGLDPSRCILFRQSDVPAHSELCWLLCSVTPYGDLQRMHQFKDKSARERELVRAGLFLYPVLQAADILAYRAEEVPVGDDQRQHLELAREIARRFNSTYGEVLVEPRRRIPELGARIMDLQDPSAKMSTTYGTDAGLVYIDDEPDVIRRKLKRAQTDSGSEVVRRLDKPGVTNLIEVLAVARGAAPAAVEREFDGQGYGALKVAVGEAVVDLLAPVRERYLELRQDEAALEATLGEGAERARAIADGMLAEVKAAMGVGRAGRWSWSGAARRARPRPRGLPRPFDLLLTLVLKEEIDLLEVDLADVVLAYVEHLERAGELDLEAATEFLLLIAALLELKSRLMLPGADDEALELAADEARTSCSRG